jgi:hypothetical protein
MSVTPRPCLSPRHHGQPEITLARLLKLGTIDATLAALLAAAVKSGCNIIVAGGVNARQPRNRVSRHRCQRPVARRVSRRGGHLAARNKKASLLRARE